MRGHDARRHDAAPLDVLRLDQLLGRDRQGLGAAGADDRGEQEVVPGEQDAQDQERADAGGHQRQNLAKGLEAGAAVAHRRLLDRVGHIVEEALEDPDREGEVEGGVGQDQAWHGPDQPGRAEDGVERDHHRHHRRHAGRDDPEEQVVLAAELDPRQRVGAHRPQHDRDQRRAAGGEEAVAEIDGEIQVGEQVVIVLEGGGEVEKDADAAPVADCGQLEGLQQVLERAHEHDEDRQHGPDDVDREKHRRQHRADGAQGRAVLDDVAGGHALRPPCGRLAGRRGSGRPSPGTAPGQWSRSAGSARWRHRGRA